VIFTRYTLGSVVAVVTSEIVLLVCYGTGLLDGTASGAVAFVAGAVPNYVLNRYWAWGRRGRVRVRREVVLYAAISLVSFVASALASGWAGRHASSVGSSEAVRDAFVGVVYLVATGVVFVAKFVVFQRYVFADGPGDRAPDPAAPVGGPGAAADITTTGAPPAPGAGPTQR